MFVSNYYSIILLAAGVESKDWATPFMLPLIFRLY